MDADNDDAQQCDIHLWAATLWQMLTVKGRKSLLRFILLLELLKMYLRQFMNAFLKPIKFRQLWVRPYLQVSKCLCDFGRIYEIKGGANLSIMLFFRFKLEILDRFRVATKFCLT